MSYHIIPSDLYHKVKLKGGREFGVYQNVCQSWEGFIPTDDQTQIVNCV